MHQQHRQQRPLLGAAERQRTVSFDHLKRPQDSKLDHRLSPRSTLPPHPCPTKKAPDSWGVYQSLGAIDRFSTGTTDGLPIGSHTAIDNKRRRSP